MPTAAGTNASPLVLDQVMNLLRHRDGVHPLPPHPQHTTELRLMILTGLSSHHLDQSIPSATTHPTTTTCQEMLPQSSLHQDEIQWSSMSTHYR